MARPMLPASTTAARKANPRIADIVAGVRARAGGLTTRAKETAVGKRATQASQRLVAHVRARPDSLTAMAANNYGKGLAAIGLGAVDRTALAEQFEGAVKVKPSTVLVALSLASRVIGLDASHPRLRSATTAVLIGGVLPKLYDLGGRLTHGMRAAAAVPPMPVAPKTAGTAGTAGYVPGESEAERPEEGIPAEATLS